MSRIRGTRNRPAAGSSWRPGRAAGQGPGVRPRGVTGRSCAGRPRPHAETPDCRYWPKTGSSARLRRLAAYEWLPEWRGDGTYVQAW